ncbi:hypothetical protein RvVAT039_24950 [Agrobacterium vitis]|uniref:hypothetical protein n=1 Tax=Agrobacterium vitis TaxID=373 RepID=UPI0015D9E4EB|nr:hypothetical protein [Agrobacterium vitis]BCH65279.1 hypothetical protein RvVAT039_24950 [Agrobacterium vitis]
MSTTVTPGIAYAYGYSSTKAAEADTEFMASLPDDSQPKTALQVEMEQMWAETAAEQAKIEAESKPATVWGTIQTEIGTATIFNEGGMAFTSTDGKSHSFADIADIDWESGYTPEELAAAIREKHFGILTTSSVESGKKSLATELMSKMFSSDCPGQQDVPDRYGRKYSGRFGRDG